MRSTNRTLLQEEGKDYLKATMNIGYFREIINANYVIGTKEESEINTGSISSFETASNAQKSGDKLYICFEIMK